MTLKEANKKLEQLENDLKYYTTEKELNLKRIGISATIYDKINVSGGKRDDKFASYMEHLEEKDKLTLIELDKKISDIKEQMKNLNNWITSELKIIGKFKDIEQQVIYLREKGYKWKDIAKETNYSIKQCQRIHNKYKEMSKSN